MVEALQLWAQSGAAPSGGQGPPSASAGPEPGHVDEQAHLESVYLMLRSANSLMRSAHADYSSEPCSADVLSRLPTFTPDHDLPPATCAVCLLPMGRAGAELRSW